MLNKLHTTFIQNLGFRWLIVVGDAKTYDILQSLRRQYGSQMQWLLPFPGDWHILYNYQKVLLKIYGETGLLQLEALYRLFLLKEHMSSSSGNALYTSKTILSLSYVVQNSIFDSNSD